MTRVIIHTGGARSGRARHLERMLADAWGRALLVVPTRAAAHQRLERLLSEHALPGCRNAAVVDFKSFAESLLLAAGERPRTADDLRRRMILETVLRGMESDGTLENLPRLSDAPGLVTHLLEVITQLKQAALEPEMFRARIESAAAPTPLDRMTAAAYEAYQHALIGAGLYDVPGLYWRACLLAADKRPCALDGIDTLLFDGFDDFTPSEFRLVTALAPHLARLVFGLAYDPGTRRTDLHERVLLTHARLRSAFSASDTEHESMPAASVAQFAADKIFWRDPPAVPPALEDNLRIGACIDPQHEAETLMRRARALLLSGVPASRVAIVYRKLSGVAEWLRAAAREYGVPAHIHHAPPLAASAAGAFLAELLQAISRWEREAVAELLTSPLFAPFGKVDPLLQSAPHIARRAIVLEGLEEWLERLEIFARRQHDVPEELAIAGAARAAVEKLSQLLKDLPARGSQASFCTALDGLLDTLGVAPQLAAWPGNEGEAERAALGALRSLLSTLAGMSSEEIPREDFVRVFLRALRETPGPMPRASAGVQCLEASVARHLEFDHVFFAGLNEGAVPQPPAMNAIYNETERARLAANGIELEGRHERAAREMALYHHLLALPRASLTLSYALNIGGREAAPSPFLVQTMELFADRPGVVEAPPLADSFLPPLADAASVREARNRAFEMGGPAVAAQFPQAAQGAAIERERYATETFGTHDGAVDGEAGAALLLARFGPEHVFSVAQLEAYAECPFQFFVRRALRIDEDDLPEAELDPRLRGEILHRVLHLFHELFVGRSVPEIPVSEAQAALEPILTRVFDERAWKAQAAPPGVILAEKQRMELLLRRYLAWAAEEHGDAWKPVRFELAFGPARGNDARDTTQPPFPLEVASGPVLFSGRIDRIDECDDMVRIIDYKTGGLPAAGEINAGISMQLGIYALACEQRLTPGKTCPEALFVRVGRADDRRAIGGKRFDRAAYEAMLLAQVDRCLRGIRAGAFAPLPRARTCYGCTTAHICRHEKARIDRKVPPPILAECGAGGGEDADEL